ncbi:flavonoid 3',5'-hydroxylase [Thelonectria olida]|uniref:Flavonoid 3',5'-hydroxylase n=1 Tax=Thelonectria olida TaxID=1576542 RepID=A0A9P8W102_9HYPO|nr:flavonoid 3',5'-hydroxylase [Thelonectria olida]
MATTIYFPSLGTIVLAVVGSALLSILYQIVYYRFFHPLAHFPGPFWGSVTRLWITYHNVRGRENDVCEELHKKFGPVMRVTPSMLLVSDATKLPLIYHRAADKSQYYITGSAGSTESIFNMQSHKKHAQYRRIAAAPYSFTSIKKMEPLVNAQLSYWLSRLDGLFASPNTATSMDMREKSFDFCPWAVYMAYDVMSEVGFGEPFGFVAKGGDVAGLIKGLRDGLIPFAIMARMYPLTNLIKKTWLGDRLFVIKPEHENGFGALMRFRDRLIEKRLQDLGEGKTIRFDILQMFLDARDENGQPLSLDYIKAEVLIVLLAGADSTGTSFQALVKFVLTNPPVYARIMAEIDAATRDKKLSSPIPQQEEVLAYCPYYVACVREAMRLIPSASSIFPRLVSKGGIELDGKYVPEGLEVTANTYLVSRDKGIYGEDAGEFRPERWLVSEEQTRKFMKYSMTFGYGTRVCLGQHLAKMEMYKAPLQLFREFTVKLCDPECPARYQVKGGVAFFEDMRITIQRREPVE